MAEEPLLVAPDGFTVVKFCLECEEAVTEFDDPIYECGSCGNRFQRSDNDSSKCDDCGKFAAKEGDGHDGCEGEEDDAVERLQCIVCEETFGDVDDANDHGEVHAMEEIGGVGRGGTRYLHRGEIYAEPSALKNGKGLIVVIDKLTHCGEVPDLVRYFDTEWCGPGDFYASQLFPGHTSYADAYVHMERRAKSNGDGTLTLTECVFPWNLERGQKVHTWTMVPLTQQQYDNEILLRRKAPHRR